MSRIAGFPRDTVNLSALRIPNATARRSVSREIMPGEIKMHGERVLCLYMCMSSMMVGLCQLSYACLVTSCRIRLSLQVAGKTFTHSCLKSTISVRQPFQADLLHIIRWEI